MDHPGRTPGREKIEMEKAGERMNRSGCDRRRKVLRLVLAFFVAGVFFLGELSASRADSRSRLFYPSETPQYANQLDVETVALGFLGKAVLLSDARHNIIVLNITGEPILLPGADNGTINLLPGQAVVVAGNSHTSPLPSIVPSPAHQVGLSPLGLSSSEGLVFVADGNGTIDAINLSLSDRQIFEVPPLGNTGALRGHVTRMIQRSGLPSGKLGLAAPMLLKPGMLSVIAGGGDKQPGDTPVDAFSCRISPVAVTQDKGRIYIAGESGRIYFLNQSPSPVMIPVSHDGALRWVKVTTGMIIAVAGLGEEKAEVDGVPRSALDVSLSPTSIAVHNHHLFLADSNGTIDEINISQDHLQVAADARDPNQVHSLDPGEIVAISGNGNDVVGQHSEPAAWVSIRPKSLAISQKGLLYLADEDHSMGAGRILAMNVSRKPIFLPFPSTLSSRAAITLLPGRIVLVAGNSGRSPLVGTVPNNSREVGLDPAQIAYRHGMLTIGNLIGSIDLVNMRAKSVLVHPLDRSHTLLLPAGRIISLMGAGVGTAAGRGAEVP
ncbi:MULTISPECIES: hypothetical protein [Leptospirillum]|jgi:hypothetical protein|nr:MULTISPECIES: hypothetical protein [Leptospirillum]